MSAPVLGILFSLLAAVGFALNAVLARPAIRYTGFYKGTLVSMLASFVLVGGITLAVDAPGLLHLTLVGAFWVALLGLLHFSLGRTFNFKAIQHIGVSRTAILNGTVPLAATLLALVLFQEEVSLLLGLGTLLVVGGVIVVLRETE
ncbi:MAG: EamA family transporter [Chloroflexi bacterium]|nr:EamA family transporter [Chloroflexota bacterium]